MMSGPMQALTGVVQEKYCISYASDITYEEGVKIDNDGIVGLEGKIHSVEY